VFWIAPWASLRPTMLEDEPVPVAIDGLPLGLQIAGFVGEDASLFAVAAAIPDLLGAAA